MVLVLSAAGIQEREKLAWPEECQERLLRLQMKRQFFHASDYKCGKRLFLRSWLYHSGLLYNSILRKGNCLIPQTF